MRAPGLDAGTRFTSVPFIFVTAFPRRPIAPQRWRRQQFACCKPFAGSTLIKCLGAALAEGETIRIVFEGLRGAECRNCRRRDIALVDVRRLLEGVRGS
jgi:hypothetical protein